MPARAVTEAIDPVTSSWAGSPASSSRGTKARIRCTVAMKFTPITRSQSAAVSSRPGRDVTMPALEQTELNAAGLERCLRDALDVVRA